MDSWGENILGWIGRQIKIEPAPPFQPMTHQNLEQQEFPAKQHHHIAADRLQMKNQG